MLTILGIVIGVGSVIMLMSIGDGLKKYVSGQFEGLGTNIITVLPVNLFDPQGRPQSQFGSPPVGGKTFSQKNVREIKRLNPDIITAIPIGGTFLQVKTGGEQRTVDVTASTAEYQLVRSITMAEGRFYTDGEVDRAKKVVVLGPTAARKFFPRGDPIGKKITVSSTPFTVIGVTNPRGAGGGPGADLDDQIYLPISTHQNLVDSDGIDFIVVKVKDSMKILAVMSDIRSYLNKSRKPDTFSVVDQRQLLSTVQSILGVMTFGLSGIAAISLVVGGIGVMNMMLVTVTERTREIGLRKALGATPRVILLQFLIESVLLSLTGGLIGISIGAAGSFIVNRFFPARVSGLAVLLAFGVSTIVGIIFGILPARRAARLSPITALRYE